MKTWTCEWKPLRAMLFISLLTGMVLASGFQPPTAAAADVVVKISRLEQALDLIDYMGMSDTGQAPTAALRGVLQDTNWIDAKRSMVLLWDTSGEHPFSAILVRLFAARQWAAFSSRLACASFSRIDTR